MKNIIKHWKTSILGLFCILLGLWSAHVTYVPTNTLQFNVLYVWPGQIALFMTGIGLLLAADNDKIK